MRAGSHRLEATRSTPVGAGRSRARTLAGVVGLVVPRHDQLGMEIDLGRLRGAVLSIIILLDTAYARLEEQQSGEGRHQTLKSYDDGHTRSIVTGTRRLEYL